MGLQCTHDAAGNLYMTLPGREAKAPAWLIGSHVDSVPNGGNFDGAAGVIAGLAAIAALQALSIVPARDVTVMAIRAEEAGSWFSGAHGGHQRPGRRHLAHARNDLVIDAALRLVHVFFGKYRYSKHASPWNEWMCDLLVCLRDCVRSGLVGRFSRHLDQFNQKAAR